MRPSQFRDVTPGSFANLHNPTAFMKRFRPTPDNPHPPSHHYVDSTHPSHLDDPQLLPKYNSELMMMRAFPFAKLAPFAGALPNPYSMPRTQVKKSQVAMSLTVVGGPQSLHKNAAYRVTVRRRLKEALRLAAVLGVEAEGQEEVDPYRLLLKGLN